MKLYNTLSKTIEEFIPHNKELVTIYTCGPTVYHYAHIGNLRTYIFEDILEKGLKYLGYNVKRTMNITDVGHNVGDMDIGQDKMIEGAKRENKKVSEIADFYTKSFFDDCAKLNIKKPDIISKATDNIDEYMKVIKKLLADGYAYQAGGNIYFDISKAKDYYKLSGKNEDDLIIGSRETVTEDVNKKNPLDFGLWFTKSKFEDQEQKWDSPWGMGYPGWHIECSAIAAKYLGEYLDIHCGGVDNIFPHHSNEIAQSEAYFGHKWCNYWVHGEHLNDRTGKMSKSKGEFLTLSLLENKGYHPLAYRFFCLGSHYRNQLVFSYDSLDIAENSYFKLKNKISLLIDDKETDINKKQIYINKFKEAISNDLNTSNMITLIYDLLKDKDISDKTKIELIADFDQVLSLDLLKEEKSQVDHEIEELIALRKEAKQNKDFSLADEIRDQILKKGYKLIDTKDETLYERI